MATSLLLGTIVAWAPAAPRLTCAAKRSNQHFAKKGALNNKAISSDENGHGDWLDTLIPSCQAAIVSTVLAAYVLLSSASPTYAFSLMPPPTAKAAVLEEVVLPKPDAIGTVTDDIRSIDPIVIQQDEDQFSVLDEVWTLIDKYYIDRTFGGQDWNKVKEKYKFLTSKARGDDAKFKLDIRDGGKPQRQV